MDNFDLKKYLIESKLTYQEKMKEKAHKIEEEELTHNPNYKKTPGAKYVDFTKYPILFYKTSEGSKYSETDEGKKAIEAFASWLHNKVAGTKGIGDFKESKVSEVSENLDNSLDSFFEKINEIQKAYRNIKNLELNSSPQSKENYLQLNNQYAKISEKLKEEVFSKRLEILNSIMNKINHYGDLYNDEKGKM